MHIFRTSMPLYKSFLSRSGAPHIILDLPQSSSDQKGQQLAMPPHPQAANKKPFDPAKN
jgi:hypothetical protein